MTNKLKNKRGFSLVELMVVVAIMGTLASIAIPAFNEYRKTAKRSTYRADLSSLHRSWLAFGVELDSFCEDSRVPVSFAAVGMSSISTSKLYGTRDARMGFCSPNTAGGNPTDCVDSTVGSGIGVWTPEVPEGSGPGKHNFIGFGFANASCVNNGVALEQVQVLGAEGRESSSATRTMADRNCDLNAGTYEMGVFGHISGSDYYGVSVNNNGVFSLESEAPVASNTANSNCST